MAGIFGICQKSVPTLKYLAYGLYAIQHRGQEAAGVASLKKGKPYTIHCKSLAKELLRNIDTQKADALQTLAFVDHRHGTEMPVEKNGALIAMDGDVFNPGFSMEGLFRTFAKDPFYAWDDLHHLEGDFSLIYMDDGKMVGYRDRLGIKPLCLGKTADGYVIASESCVVDAMQAEFIRDFEPGEMVVIDKTCRSVQSSNATKRTDVFEFIYTARPDSVIDGVLVHDARYKMGERLAAEWKIDADVVIGSPDSGLIAAQGYSHASGLPYSQAIIKNRYIGRTFIEPDERVRREDVFIKLNPIKSLIKNKRVIIVDDSIVRGLTIKRLIEILRNAGATEVHVCIACPPVIRNAELSPELPKLGELISYEHTTEEVQAYIQSDTLHFLSLDGLKTACSNIGFMDYCFTGNYPF